MERRTCKLCFRSFSNGRALGGHMRSHFAAATVSSTAAAKPLLPDDISTSTSSREAGAKVQGRESETELLPLSQIQAKVHRRRPERPHRSSATAPNLLSSVSDVALCLMMLSRDVWSGDKDGAEESDEQKFAGRFQCRSCKKAFRSYQALGGHRANHKKSRCCTALPSPESNDGACGSDGKAVVHECLFCFRVFTSGKALGGHKRSHPTSSTTTFPTASPPLPSPATATSKLTDALFDLNLPAPPDEDNGMEHSAASDHESAVSHRPLKC